MTVTSLFTNTADGKESACSAGDLVSIPDLGRSSGEGNGNPFQYSCLENSMDRGAWWATVHGVTESWMQLSNYIFTFHSIAQLLFISLPSRTIVVVQLLSRVQLFATPWTAALQVPLSSTVSMTLLKLMSIESMMPSNHLTLCHPFLLLPSIFPSVRVFSNESVC